MAMLAALNAHDVAAVKAFLHPSWTRKDRKGRPVARYHQVLEGLPVYFRKHPQYQQAVDIEGLEVNGDTARIHTRRVERLKVLWFIPWKSVSRFTETWNRVGGQWVMTEEQMVK
jgi:hypothetical protein